MRVRFKAAASLGAKSRTWYVCGINTSLDCFCSRNGFSAATKPSGVYGSSLADSRSYTFDTFVAAISLAMSPTPLPATAASSVQPVSAAIACAPVMVSQETRFSLPSRCSTTTRMVSAISIRSYLPLLLSSRTDFSREGSAFPTFSAAYFSRTANSQFTVASDAASAIAASNARADDIQQQTHCDQHACDDLKPCLPQLACRRLKEHDQECKQHQHPANDHEEARRPPWRE